MAQRHAHQRDETQQQQQHPAHAIADIGREAKAPRARCLQSIHRAQHDIGDRGVDVTLGARFPHHRLHRIQRGGGGGGCRAVAVPPPFLLDHRRDVVANRRRRFRRCGMKTRDDGQQPFRRGTLGGRGGAGRVLVGPGMAGAEGQEQGEQRGRCAEIGGDDRPPARHREQARPEHQQMRQHRGDRRCRADHGCNDRRFSVEKSLDHGRAAVCVSMPEQRPGDRNRCAVRLARSELLKFRNDQN